MSGFAMKLVSHLSPVCACLRNFLINLLSSNWALRWGQESILSVLKNWSWWWLYKQNIF